MSAIAQVAVGYVVGKVIGEVLALVLVIGFLWTASRR